MHQWAFRYDAVAGERAFLAAHRIHSAKCFNFLRGVSQLYREPAVFRITLHLYSGGIRVMFTGKRSAINPLLPRFLAVMDIQLREAKRRFDPKQISVVQ